MKQKITKIFVSIFMLITSMASNAQIVDPPGDGDPPAAPINNYLIVLVFVGIYFAYKILNKNIVKTK